MDAINAAYPTLGTTLPCYYDVGHTDPMTSINTITPEPLEISLNYNVQNIVPFELTLYL